LRTFEDFGELGGGLSFEELGIVSPGDGIESTGGEAEVLGFFISEEVEEKSAHCFDADLVAIEAAPLLHCDELLERTGPVKGLDPVAGILMTSPVRGTKADFIAHLFTHVFRIVQ
jgi:hypothetical protein